MSELTLSAAGLGDPPADPDDLPQAPPEELPTPHPHSPPPATPEPSDPQKAPPPPTQPPDRPIDDPPPPMKADPAAHGNVRQTPAGEQQADRAVAGSHSMF